MAGNKNATEVLLADATGIARAAEILERGGLVAVPTETVYGLAARVDSAEAVAKIYEAKGRPSFNPLIVHVRDVEQAARLADVGAPAEELMAAFFRRGEDIGNPEILVELVFHTDGAGLGGLKAAHNCQRV